MENPPALLPDGFFQLVRDALLHIYDTTYLQMHPLATYVSETKLGPVATGKLLCQTLLDAINALHPVPGAAGTSTGLRTYRILELRYIVGRETVEVRNEVALSRRQYQREHRRAIEAVASFLWEHWRLAERWSEEEEHLLEEDARDPIDPLEVLQSIEELFRPLCLGRDIELRVQVSGELQPILGDRVALRQALMLPIGRLIEVVSGGVIAIEATCREQQLEVELWSDPTFSVDELDTALEESWPFVSLLHGNLETHASSLSSLAWKLKYSFPLAERLVLLVVDNNQDFIGLVKRYLIGQPWEVAGATEVGTALRLARELMPKAVLLDVVLSGQDGWDLLKAMRSTPVLRDTPVVVCSVLHESSLASALGVAAYLHKPITQRQLLEAISSAVSWR